MTLALHEFPTAASPLRGLDPRWKLAAVALATLAVAALHTAPAAAGALAGAVLLALLSRQPWRWYLARLTGVGLLLVLFAGVLPFLLRDEGPAWELGPLRLSLHGLAVAALVVCKALAIVLLVLVLLATTPFDATLKAAHALHVPGLLVQIAMLTYRYLFVLGGELARLRVAVRVRGYRNRVSRHAYRTVGHVAGTLLVRGYERAERVGQAMRCRGFDGCFRSLAEFRTRPGDGLFFLAIVGGAAGLFAWDWWLR